MSDEQIRSELRVVDDKPEIWTNLGDILDWLQELPTKTEHPDAGAAALDPPDAPRVGR